MSFQLIYNHRLRKRRHGDQSGVLLKSQDIPSWLEDIVLLSCRVTGRADSPLRYTYRVVTVETGEYHILSCSKGGGIHNLILTPQEVIKLRRNANRPTPAGIMLALSTAQFWAADVQTPSLHCEEPRLPASALPGAEFQQTWKELTGHKNNARAFLTAPFNKDCLIVIPSHLESQMVLRLLHESDWLSSQRGWGRTFTTMAQMGDTFEETARICVPMHMLDSAEGSVWAQQATTLNLCSPFVLAELQEVQMNAIPAQQTNAPSPEVAAGVYVPYVYQECPDEEMYNILPPSHPLLRWSCYICGLILLGVCVHFMVSETADDAGKVTRKAIEVIKADDSILQLKELSKEPYSPDSITRTLDKIYALVNAAPVSEREPDNEVILEIIYLLKCADSDTKGHADNILRLRECATELKLNPDKLSRLYLNEAIHECSVSDWEAHLTPSEIARWSALLSTAPLLRDMLRESPFAPYMEIILQPTSSETTDTHPVKQTENKQTKMLPSLPCVEGTPVPSLFEQALRQAPLLLKNGQWSIIRRYADSMTRTRFSGCLDEKENILRIEEVAEGSYRIVPLMAQKGGDVPVLHFEIEDGKLQKLRCDGGNPAAASIPLPVGTAEYTPIMLLPHREVTLQPSEIVLPPSTEQLGLELSEKDVVLQQGDVARLEISGNKGYPWTRMHSELPLQQGQALLHLPVLIGANKLAASPGLQEDEDYCWTYGKLPTSNTASESFDCHLLRVYDFSPELRRRFHEQANAYCMGSEKGDDAFFSLASLYALSVDAENPDKAAKAVQNLLRLRTNPDFSVIMDSVLMKDAVWKNALNKLNQHTASKLLSDAKMRQSIRKCILAKLSEEIRRAYTECRAREMHPSAAHCEMKLCLQQVRVSEQGELVWEFALRKVEQP